MVALHLKRIIVGLVLTMIFLVDVKGQTISFDLGNADTYRNWSFFLGPVIYDKARVASTYGPFVFNAKRMLGYNVGFEYDFHRNSRVSFSTGLTIALEPGYHFTHAVKKEDIYPQFEEDIEHRELAYTISSFSLPLLVHYKILTKKKKAIDLFAGMKAMLFPSGNLEYIASVSNRTLTSEKDVFHLYLDSPDNYIQGSFVFGSGYELKHKKRLWKVNLIRVINFQNLLEGQYWTKNLNVTPLSAGQYKLSGNYWGILCSIALKKKSS